MSCSSHSGTTQAVDQPASRTRIVMITPYFGTFPANFPMWLHSCAANPSIHFRLITDNTVPFRRPDNVQVVHQTFFELRRQYQAAYDFPVRTESGAIP